MLRKALVITPLLLCTYGISHAVSDADIHVCEAQASDDLRVKCYRDLMLNPSCHVLKKDQLSCFRRSALRTILGGRDKASPKKNNSEEHGDDIFGQPRRLCSALSHIGLGTSDWEEKDSDSEKEWRCLSEYSSFGSPGAKNSKNEIAYHISGTSSARAKDIRIILDINNPSEREQAFGRLEAATRTLFKAISEHLPLELVLALRHKTPISIFTDFGTVNLIRTANEKEGYIVALTDTKLIPDRQQLRARTTDDFSSCRRVTAKAAGYSASQISGTGIPYQGPGFRGYRLNGRGMDWFICKVYPGGKYKIETAMDGKAPRGNIAEGTF